MELELWQAALLQAIVIGSPILLAACGELLGQRVGVFNIGIEGVMLMGAVGGFMVAAEAGNVVVGLIGAAAFGAGFVFLFGLATVVLRANQVVAGFGLWLLGLGLSSQIGRPYTGKRAEHPIDHWEIPGLHEIPWVGDILFEHLWLAYVAFLIPFFIALVMFRTRHGLNIRSVGEDPGSADASGVSVIAWRLAYVVFGGALIGLSGAFLSLGTVQNWTPFMTSGLGWIGLAVVIFAGWRPLLLIVGAYLFGGLRALDFIAQSGGWNVPPEVLTMLPFIGTVAVLILGAWRYRHRPDAGAAPRALGQAFFRGS